ncbi:MAG: isopenicillin N synthase family oxygenase [Chitinophagales bacterium]|nr:isopenicillin N synthase family oxygenase [Chitinophagales bacterium]
MVPILDLALFEQGTIEEKNLFSRQLGDAFSEIGFVCIKNHGVPQTLIDKYYALVKEFFSLPEEVKRKYEVPELAGQRGYTSFGRETAKGFTAPDLKEFWQLGQEVEGDDPIKNEYPENFVVKEVPDFTSTGITLFKSFERCGKTLLRAIAIYLSLPEYYFDEHVYNGNSILRAIHYPPITREPQNAIRAEQHEDINLITLLAGASAEGLQILYQHREWIDVTAPEGCLVINVGDMLQRHTNNRLKSTTHRVVNPPRELWHTSRYSIPFFMHPRSNMRLDCLPSCITEDNPRAYEPITAGEYLEERLAEIGLKK